PVSSRTSQVRAASEIQGRVNTDAGSPAQAAPAGAENDPVEVSSAYVPDAAGAGESLAVIGENVTVHSPTQPLRPGSASSSSTLTLVVLIIVIIFVVGTIVWLFLRLSA
ncbi:MAG: hypothetical protein R3293_24380, partial [Candidatus Promineifilaceae bacterium]|nr:hypothetical protein [Candidatus Promineifilaceae bacterium]